LKLECDESRSRFAFNFNLRRYTKGFLSHDDVAAELHMAGRPPLLNII